MIDVGERHSFDLRVHARACHRRASEGLDVEVVVRAEPEPRGQLNRAGVARGDLSLELPPRLPARGRRWKTRESQRRLPVRPASDRWPRSLATRSLTARLRQAPARSMTPQEPVRRCYLVSFRPLAASDGLSAQNPIIRRADFTPRKTQAKPAYQMSERHSRREGAIHGCQRPCRLICPRSTPGSCPRDTRGKT